MRFGPADKVSFTAYCGPDDENLSTAVWRGDSLDEGIANARAEAARKYPASKEQHNYNMSGHIVHGKPGQDSGTARWCVVDGTGRVVESLAMAEARAKNSGNTPK